MKSIEQEVRYREEEMRSRSSWRRECVKIGGIIIGCFIYTIGINYFLRPLHLYSAGFMGFAQLFNNILVDFLGIKLHIDLTGIFYYILNIPGLILTYKYMRKRYLVKTVITVTCSTVFLTIIPIASQSILEEVIANALTAGLIAGVGIGIILRMGACDGGMNLISMILVQKRKGDLSVGQWGLLCNFVLYIFCMALYDVPTVIYSLVYAAASALATDKVHAQNINVQVLIVTKLRDSKALEIEIMGQLERGITRWAANGAYTGNDERVLMVIISKYEINKLRNIVHEIDPHAFMIVNEDVNVDGHFLKKLT